MVFFLPRNYYLFNDVALEVFPNEFIQIDHLILSRWGIHIVETKNWKGYFNTLTGGWTGTGSLKDPVDQMKRIRRLFSEWLNSNGFNVSNQFITDHILLYDGKIGMNDNPNVVTSSLKAVKKIVNDGQNISKEELDKLVKAIKHAKPLDHLRWFRENGVVTDDRIVYFQGSERQLHIVKAAYERKGLQVAKYRQIADERWEMKLVNHVQWLEEKMEQALKSNYKRNRSRDINYPKWFKRFFVTAGLAGVLFYFFDELEAAYEKLHIQSKDWFQSLRERELTHATKAAKVPSKLEEPTLVIRVKEKKTYIMLKDGNKKVLDHTFPKGSVISIYPNLQAVIEEPGTKRRKIFFTRPVIEIEVANRYSEVIHNGVNINRNRVDGFYHIQENAITYK